MSLKEDLQQFTAKTFNSLWTDRVGQVIPQTNSVTFENDSITLQDAVVLYADLRGSTGMVDGFKWWFSAEIYKNFLYCSAKIIKSLGGEITAYDGDRIMAVFIKDNKCDAAVKAGLQINWAVKNVVMLALKQTYPNVDFELKHTVGIDMSELHVVKTGVRVDNDLVWVGRAANHAAKLTELKGHPTYITMAVYQKLSSPYTHTKGTNMWQLLAENSNICSSSWSWAL